MIEVLPRDALVAPSAAEGFLSTVRRTPDAVALEIGQKHWTYLGFSELAGSIAHAVAASNGTSKLVAVFASRSLTRFAGSLAVFGAGAAFVALNPAHPVRRAASIVGQADVATVIVGPEALKALPELLSASPGVRCVIAPETDDLSALRTAHAGVRFVDAGELQRNPAPFAAPPVKPDDLAYLVFTSGSTGVPKGVAISHGNLAVWMRNFRAFEPPLATDRVATIFELTFDMALNDMLQTWWSGATLCVVSDRQVMAPARFIQSERITYWFSVSSVAMLSEQQGTLKPGVFPLLRVSMLCGEPLPDRSAAAWAAAAPNSVLYNVYGPTETTMELAFYRWDPASSPAACRRGVVPIGIPFEGHEHILLDSDGHEVAGVGRGELLLAGPQIGLGYWKLPDRTAQSFVELPGRAGRWYRTGDFVERDENGLYHFVARIDNQVKLRGHRIELGEIEAALRDVAGTSLVAVIPHPVIGGNAQGLVAFVAGGPPHDVETLRRGLAERVPPAMVPERFERLADLPLNDNQKIDRRALLISLEK